MGFTFSEEAKEAILRAKGKGVFVMTLENGEATFLPECFDIVKETKDSVILKIRHPEAPTKEKVALVDAIVARIKPQLESSITNSVRQALLEKPEAELVAAKEAKEPRVERRRGCFFLVTEEQEFLL